MTDRATMERAFERARAELEIPSAFPPAVLAEAEQAAGRREWQADGSRADLTHLPFVTIDPPGSRDLDQALLIERGPGGFRVTYAIADVACFVDRGGAIEREAWRRGLTHYSPDRRDPLYPPVLSQGAASLLPDEERPAIVFTLELDPAGALASYGVRRARIRSREQLTYAQALEHIQGDGASLGDRPFAESLLLLREVGELRLRQERERGGVSLPIREQHVQQRTAMQLGYEVVYEDPNVAEEWNAQISLLTGHAAAERMLAAGVGLLRTQPPARPEDLTRLRAVARLLGFQWPDGQSYPEFLHSVDPTHPALPLLVWQSRRLMRGADYVAFDGAPPEHSRHSALALTYAHCTAPLRRLADRYVLDLLVKLELGDTASETERATLQRLPAVMDGAEGRANKLERRVVDIAEAWSLRDRIGIELPAVVMAAQREWVDVQIADPPVRVRVPRRKESEPPALGATVRARVTAVTVEEGKIELEL